MCSRGRFAATTRRTTTFFLSSRRTRLSLFAARSIAIFSFTCPESTNTHTHTRGRLAANHPNDSYEEGLLYLVEERERKKGRYEHPSHSGGVPAITGCHGHPASRSGECDDCQTANHGGGGAEATGSGVGAGGEDKDDKERSSPADECEEEGGRDCGEGEGDGEEDGGGEGAGGEVVFVESHPGESCALEHDEGAEGEFLRRGGCKGRGGMLTWSRRINP